MALRNQLTFKSPQRKTNEEIVADYIQSTQMGPQLPVQPQATQPGFGQRFLSSFTEFAKSPEGMQSLVDLAGLVAAGTQKDPYVSSAIAKQVGTNIAQRPILEQQRLERERKAEDRERKKLLDQALLAQRQSETAKNIIEAQPTPEVFKPAKGFIKANLSQDFIEDPQAKRLGIIQENPKTGEVYVNTAKISDYVQEKDLAKINLESDIENTKIRNEQINKIITDPNLSKLIGTKGIGPIRISKEFIQSIGGTPQEINSLIASINTQDANKILETIKKLKSQSRTGATGFGALSAPELNIITNAFYNLSRAQDINTFVTNLKDIDEIFSNATERSQRDYLNKYINKDIELYQNPYKQITTETETQEEIVSQPEFKGYKLVTN